MISEKLQNAINEQITAEMWSANLYLAMSFYFEKGNFVLKTTRVAHIESNGTLVFRNKMNSILFPVNFTSRDYDIFFTICWYAKQLGYSDSRNYIEKLYFKIS